MLASLLGQQHLFPGLRLLQAWCLYSTQGPVNIQSKRCILFQDLSKERKSFFPPSKPLGNFLLLFQQHKLVHMAFSEQLKISPKPQA